MKRKPDQLKKLLIFNVLILALCVVITINLLETGGTAASAQAPLTAVTEPVT